MPDKRILHISSISILAVLLIALIVPFGESGRIIAAILLLPAAILTHFFIKKRNILSINKKQILLLITVIALVYTMLYYVSGIYFGFYLNPHKLNVTNILMNIVPISVIIVSTEIIRYVIFAQKNKLANVFCYLSCVVAEMLVCSTIPAVNTFNKFMDLVAGALLPALISNLLYNYLSVRYGIYPNIVFRLITTLHLYIIPVKSGISESLFNFLRLLLPIAIYLFIDTLYERKRRYALGGPNRFIKVISKVLTVVIVIFMIGTIMIVSNQFKIGALVIATDSMTGELNKGDVAIYESYDDQLIQEGQVIVFAKNDSMIVHRVADIQIINGNTRYYTKGDANEDLDMGFITDADIVGIVNYKLPLVGFPTLWMRNLFNR